MLRIHTGFLGMLASCQMAALVLIAAGPALADDRHILNITTPQPFPDIRFKDIAGKPLTLSGTAGKLTIVHFWATWCVPCVDELPLLEEIQKKYEVVGLKVLSISMDGDANRTKVDSFLRNHNITSLTPYMDSSAFQDSRAKGMPTSFFINSAGERIAMAEGPLDWLNPKTTGFLEFNLYRKDNRLP